MSTVDPNQRFVDSLQGPGLSLFVVSVVGGIASLIVVGLRTFIRLQNKNFSLDDALMLSGLIAFLAVYVLLGLIVATFMTTFVGILLLCRPVEANWDQSIVLEGRGECATTGAMLGLSYTSTASTIATDLACAVLPAVILWHTQMKPKTKFMLASVLSFGSFASVSTMIRTPYIDHYNRPTEDLAYHIANVPLWSNVETAIGLVAGSLPALHQFIARRRSPRSTTVGTNVSGGVHPASGGLVTIGGSGGASKIKNRKSLGSNFEMDGADWTRLDEDIAYEV